jgi:hypothetical protein
VFLVLDVVAGLGWASGLAAASAGLWYLMPAIARNRLSSDHSDE